MLAYATACGDFRTYGVDRIIPAVDGGFGVGVDDQDDGGARQAQP